MEPEGITLKIKMVGVWKKWKNVESDCNVNTDY